VVQKRFASSPPARMMLSRAVVQSKQGIQSPDGVTHPDERMHAELQVIRNPRVVSEHYEYAGLEYKGGKQKRVECPNWDELYVGQLVNVTVRRRAVALP